MTKILFICLGNICRIPMAEFVMKDLVEKVGLADEFQIDSAATCRDEIGNPVYPPARAVLKAHGISCEGKRAALLRFSDAEKYDLFACMDESNLRSAKRILGAAGAEKCKKLLSFAGGGDVSDPWYTRDFERAYEDICRGIEGLLKTL